MPCMLITAKNTVNVTPTTHLKRLDIKLFTLSSLIELLRLPTRVNTIDNMNSGRTNETKSCDTPLVRSATAGLYSPTELVLPTDTASVSKIGKTAFICDLMDVMVWLVVVSKFFTQLPMATITRLRHTKLVISLRLFSLSLLLILPSRLHVMATPNTNNISGIYFFMHPVNAVSISEKMLSYSRLISPTSTFFTPFVTSARLIIGVVLAFKS